MADPNLPRLDDLASAPLTHNWDDMFNPPGLTNFLGAAQVDFDLVAVRSVNFPPVGAGDTITGNLFVDGRLFRSLQPKVTVVWRPDRVTRHARAADLELESTTACAPGATAVVVELRVTNLGASHRQVRLGLALNSAVTMTGKAWKRPEPPSRPNRFERDASRHALIGVCPKSGASCVQGIDVECDWVAPNVLEVAWELAPGQTRRFGFVHAVAPTRQLAQEVYDRVVVDAPGAIKGAEALWEEEIAGAFCRGEGSFSGSLPVLETES